MSLRCKHRKATESNPLQTSNGMAVAKEKIKQLLLGLLLLTNPAFSGYAIGSEVQSSSTQVDERRVYRINLPSQSIADSLASLSEQLDLLLLFPYQTANHLQANPVNGRYTLPQALALVLKDTGFSGRLTHKGVLMIELDELDGANQKGIKERGNMNTHKRKSLLATLVGLAVAGGAVPQVYGQDGAAGQSQINEVFVTADKRDAKSVQDLAASITALGADEIDKRGLVSMDDYLRDLPGVSMQDRGAMGNSIVIRGMATNPQGSDSTAGAYFGETPIANIRSASQSGSAGNADLKLIDIERVEVLRGPQGTLYGSGSMAGTLRIVPNAPNLDEVEGSVSTRLSNTAEAGGNNNSMRGVLNVPFIKDQLALRAVVYRIDNSGFIDNVAAREPTERVQEHIDDSGVVVKDVGDRGGDITTGFRLAALWQATDELGVTLSYIQQDVEQDGLREVELDVGRYKQARWQIGENRNQDEFLDIEFELTNLVLKYDLGWAELTSSSSWIDNDSDLGMNSSSSAHSRENTASVDLFVEELRLASQWEGPLQLVTGLYYEDKESELDTFWRWSGDPVMDPYPDPELPRSKLDKVVETEHVAFFSELTYAFSEYWKATIGGRHFDYDVKDNTFLISRGNVFYKDEDSTSSVLIQDGTVITKLSEDGQNYKGVLTYTPNEDLLIYGQWAQGFRIGGTQVGTTACRTASEPVLVPGIDSDTADTFEIGVKSSWADNQIILNAAIYRTDWKDIPVSVATATDTGTCRRTLNAGKALSEGIEVELQAQITENFRVDVRASVIDATLEEDFNFGGGLIGEKGDDLPGSADYNASVGFEYGFTVGSYPSFARLDYAYVGEYYNSFEETDNTPAGDFSQVHFKLGTQVGQVALDVFVNNLTNDDGLTWVEQNFTRFSGTRPAYRIRPRTMGINIGYQF